MSQTRKIYKPLDPLYWQKYYRDHKHQILQNQKKYLKTKKGKLTRQRYELTDQRRKQKKLWARKYRSSERQN